jgi:hypothetical protein
MTRRVLLDRDLARSWLDAAMELAASNTPAERARVALHDRLRNESLGEVARAKTVTALVRSWINPEPRVAGIVQWAAKHAAEITDSRPLHVGVLLATQPFFADQATIVGRILAVQDDVETPVVRARMKAIWGPRRSVDVATQRTIKTMRAIGMLEGKASDSISYRATPIAVTPQVGAWLVTCILAAREADAISSTELASAPELAAIAIPRCLDVDSVGIGRFTEGTGRIVYASARASLC